MRRLVLAALAATIMACGGASQAQPRLPTGVTCTADAAKAIETVPDRANPDSPKYDVEYAIGWYLGHDGCTASPSAWPSLPN